MGSDMPDFAALSDADLLALLRTEEDRLPRAFADEVLRRIDRLEPALVALLQNDALWRDEGREWWALVHAVRLLAASARPSAFEVVQEAVSRAYEEDLEWIWIGAREILTSFGPAFSPRIVQVVEEHLAGEDLGDATEEDQHSLACHLDALAMHAAHGKFPLDQLFKLAVRALEKDGRDEELEETASCILSVWIANGSEAEVSDALGMSVKTAKKSMPELWRQARRFDETPEQWFTTLDLLSFYSADAIEERARSRRDDTLPDLDLADMEKYFDELEAEEIEDDDGLEDAPPPPIRLLPKPGRNDPCSCGSGKKYKKCCEGKPDAPPRR